MKCFLIYIADKLWPVVIAVVTTQVLAQKFFEMRKPKLEMVPEGMQSGKWKIFNSSQELAYHMWRINVQHIKFPWYLAWLMKYKETALQCKADLTFYDSRGQELFRMQGRWVNTPQVSFISPLDQQAKIIYPDTKDIGYQSPEPLDCIVKFDDEKVAYGWNNEAYAVTDNKNPRCKLETGKYRADVRLSGLNIRQITTKFNIVIAGGCQETSLTLAEDQPSV